MHVLRTQVETPIGFCGSLAVKSNIQKNSGCLKQGIAMDFSQILVVGLKSQQSLNATRAWLLDVFSALYLHHEMQEWNVEGPILY